jgi:hypothetical protein
VLGPTHLAPTITGRHDRHLGGYTASSSAWARYPTLGRLTDRQQPVDDKHSENSPVSTAAAVPAYGISQNAHGFRNETCRAHSDLAVVERTTRVRLFCDPLSAECSSSRQRLGLASTLPVQSGPQRRPRPGGWASTGKALAARAFTPSSSPCPQWVACQGSVVTSIVGRAGCGCSDFHSERAICE